MKISRFLNIILILLSSNLASAQTVLINKTFYPEGPLLLDRRLYFVEYSKSKIKTIELGSENTENFWNKPNCGPASIFHSKNHFYISCYDLNVISILDKIAGTEEIVSLPQNIIGPNDFTGINEESFFLTASGTFDINADKKGQVILYRNGHFEVLADELYYPNGLVFLPEKNKLFVSEHFKNRIISFDYDAGKLINKQVFVNLPKVNNDPYLGPDGIKYSKKSKSLFIAQYGGSRIYQYSLDGQIIKSYKIDAKYPTNIAIEKDILYITAVIDANSPPYPGRVYTLLP